MTEMMPGNVTLADLFRVMSAMQADVAKVVTRLEVVDTVNRSADDIHRDHESRIRVLESFRGKFAGAVIFAGLSSAGIADLVFWILSHH